MHSYLSLLLLSLSLLIANPLAAQAPSGEVTVPLPVYSELLEQSRQQPRPAQAEYAIGEASIQVNLNPERGSATVDLSAVIETFTGEWTLVPLLPSQVAVAQVSIDGQPTALVQSEQGLAWSTQEATRVNLQLRYTVDAQRSAQQWLVSLPLPRTTSTELMVNYPGLGVELAAVPASDVRQSSDEAQQRTTLQATLAMGEEVTISWREPLTRRYALSRANYQGEHQGDALGWRAEFQVETFTDESLTLPLFPTSITLSDVQVNGEAATVLLEDDHFAVALQGRGSHRIMVAFHTPLRAGEGPPAVRFAIPAVPVSRFELSLPGNREVSVSPAANVMTRSVEAGTVATAFLPLSDSVEFSWVEAIPEEMRGQVRANASLYHLVYAEPGVLLGRALAVYDISHGETGQLQLEIPADAQVNRIRGPGVSDWSVSDDPSQTRKRITVFLNRAVHGEYTLEVDYERLLDAQVAEEPVAVPLLSALEINRQRGVVALLAGPELGLEPMESDTLVDVSEHQLPPTVLESLSMKVARTYKYIDPEARLMVRTVAPERRRARINVNLYHTLRAEPGVLLGRAFALYEITQGESDLLELDIAPEAQINRISSPQATVADWSVTRGDGEARKQLQVFLETPVQGELLLDIAYERLLDGDQGVIDTPLLQALGANRQRGMIALLGGKDRVLNPQQSEGLSGIGEDQLPALVRNQLSHPVAHTYRYIATLPTLEIDVAVPEREQGLFDAQVDTLISLDEVSLRASASVGLSIKSGSLMELALQLPDDLNILSVSAPSLRSQQVQETPDGQQIQLAFTQEMAGQLQVEVVYERVFSGNDGATPIPVLAVPGAEIEHGRIAVEALSAVELAAATTEGLSRVDTNELPRQLVLKTTNPILLAYKYVRAETPLALALNITRHQDIELQAATIETANYSSLYTQDGLAVTVARFQVRNTRRQFLRLALPPESEVWSVFVNDQAEQPARADTDNAVLIPLLNESAGFPVEVIYATRVAPMDSMGTLRGQLPEPDIIVTQSHWRVLLPMDFYYWQVDANLEVLSQGRRIQADGVDNPMQTVANRADGGPLRIQVPNQGIELRLTRLYANQAADASVLSVSYVARDYLSGSRLLTLLGSILLGVLLVLWRFKRHPQSPSDGA